ncbi:transglycosylase domain-containing protein [Myxococcota bacterium]|nr:transglycosylase domain-containing protein [Myxococcota bacterium]
MDVRLNLPRQIRWATALVAVWIAAVGVHNSFVELLRYRLAGTIGFSADRIALSCGGLIRVEGGVFSHSGNTVRFHSAEFGPDWLQLGGGAPILSLQVNLPEVEITVRKFKPKRLRTVSLDGLRTFFRMVHTSFSGGRVTAKVDGQVITLENVGGQSRPGGSFLLTAPLIHVRGPRGVWIGKNTEVEMRGRQWERLQVSFMRIMSSSGVWLDAGGTVERVSSTVFGVDLFLRHGNESATFRGRANLDENRHVLDVSFSTTLASLFDYAREWTPLPPFVSTITGKVDGEAHVVWSGAPVRVDAKLNLREAAFSHSNFSSQRMSLPDVRLFLTGQRQDEGVDFSGKVTMGGPEVRFTAQWNPGRNLKFEGSTAVWDCQRWMHLGRDLMPNLRGMELSGDLGLHFGLWFDLVDAEKFNAHGRFSGTGYTVVRDAEVADPHRLLGPVTVTLKNRFGMKAERRMDPSEPTFVPLAKIPAHTVAAFLTTEDRRFREHHGFDWPMLVRAAGYNLKHRAFYKGASSISQQLVKNIFLTSTRSISRKLEEAILTWRMEQIVPKDRILELYLNVIEMGPGLWGISDGARTFFSREVRNLIPAESAHLALITPAPLFYYYQMRRSSIPDAWTSLIMALLRKLHLQGALTTEEYQAAKIRGLVLQDY